MPENKPKLGNSGTNDIITPIGEKKHASESVSCYTITVYCCKHPMQTNWPRKHIQNLFLPALGPYHGTPTTSHTITIDQNRIPNTISEGRPFLAPIHMQRKDGIVDEEHNQSLLDTAARTPGRWNYQSRKSRDTGSQKQEYTVDYIVRPVGNGRRRKYVVPWNGYTLRDDTLEPPDNAPHHLISGYWRKAMKFEKWSPHKSPNWSWN